jgi:N-acetylmuramoyl-L-alanine amidase
VIRIGCVCTALFLLVSPPFLSPVLPASTDRIVLLLEGQRREVAPVVRGDVEMLPLDQVVQGLGITVHSDPAGGAVTLGYGGREAALYHKKSIASVGGELKLLPAPALYEETRWLVPVEGLPRVLGPILGRNVEWRSAARVLVLGNVSIPKIAVSTYVSGETVRVVLESSEKLPFRVLQEEGRATVTVARDLVDVSFTQERLTGGIVELVQYLGGKDNLFAVTVGKRFQQLKAYEQETPARLVLEFQGPPAAARPREAAASPAPAPSPSARPAAPVVDERPVRTIVIDPGHGGEEVGAKGPGGTLEKDVTLAIARKLRTALANNLGLQVFLTRDKDQEVPLDERTAIANNYKADLFISIHANASRSHGVGGSEVYFLSYQASDDESRRIAQSEGAAIAAASSAAAGSAAPPPPAANDSDLALILWNMAQAEHLEESSALASRIHEELAKVTGSEGRGIKQAPFRVLVGAAMPAVLVEVAFISHPEEEKLLTSEAWQNKVAGALMHGVAQYEADQARRAGLTAAGRRGGS